MNIQVLKLWPNTALAKSWKLDYTHNQSTNRELLKGVFISKRCKWNDEKSTKTSKEKLSKNLLVLIFSSIQFLIVEAAFGLFV